MTPRLAVLLLVACAACSSSSTASGPSPLSVTPTPAATTEAPTPTPTVAVITPAPVRTSAKPAATSPTMILEGDGLGFLVGSSSIRHFTFGEATSDQITTAVTNAIGAGSSSADTACGQGARSSYQVKGFSMLFDKGTLVGWTNTGVPGHVLTSADGIGIGITLAKLKTLEADVKVTSGSLGPEWFAGDKAINGLLSGTTSTSKVTAVYAGETCFAR
jgi:hypothetical protein